MRGVDTNILVRAIVRDDEADARAAASLLDEGDIYIPVTVILELEWILRSRYGYSPATIADGIVALASLENAVVAEQEAIVTAAQRLRAGWDFADALHHALSTGCEEFLTFDKSLIRNAGRVKGIEPRVTAVVKR